MKYELKFYPNGSDRATASVCMKAGDPKVFEKFSEMADDHLRAWGDSAKEARNNGEKLCSNFLRSLHKFDPYTPYDPSAPGKVVCECGGVRWAELFFCEEDAVAAVLCCCYCACEGSIDNFSMDKDGVSEPLRDRFLTCYRDLPLDVSINCKGDIYTDIPKLSVVFHELGRHHRSPGFCGIRFFARKNGGEPAEYYLLTKVMFAEPEDFPPVTLSPSVGIVGTSADCLYAGSYLRIREHAEYTGEGTPPSNVIGSTGWIDEDGNHVIEAKLNPIGMSRGQLNALTDVLSEEGGGETEPFFEMPEPNEDGEDDFVELGVPVTRLMTAAHLFLERDGENFAFSALINGKLYKKISKTENAVIFYNTPLMYVNNSTDAEYKKCTEQIVFRNVNGEYVNEEYELGGDWRYLDKAVNSRIVLPPVPEGDDLDPGIFAAFYSNCVRALHKAFNASEKYFTTKYELASNRTVKIFVEEWNEKARSRFATDDPPACRRDIRQIGGGKYLLSYENAEFTLRPSAKHRDIIFEEYFNVPLPDFEVESVAFAAEGGAVALKPDYHSLEVRITDGDTGEVFAGGFGLLKAHPSFSSANIPSNLYLKPQLTAVIEKLDIYRAIRDTVEKLGVKRCGRLLDNDPASQKSLIAEKLYGDKGMIPDENVISTAAQLENEFIRTKRVPNIAIVGQAGSGKTNLANNLGAIFGKEILKCTPSDLRGAYVGHTKYYLVEKLTKAARENKILFVDEVYQLMDDSFGQEAITILLPLMADDKAEELEVSLDKGQKDTLRLYFGDIETGEKGHYERLSPSGSQLEYEEFAPGIVPIWIAGYEDEVRRMISMNQGLYRRFKKVIIRTPVTSELIDQLKVELEEMAGGSDNAARKAAILKRYFSENGVSSVRKFFGWGIQPQNSKYFASHAGVTNFLGSCIDSIDFGKDPGTQIEEVITSIKLDIKRQLAALRNGADHKETSADTINVITDIDTRFKDLVGCESQIAYMQSIIDLLVNKAVYEEKNLTVPKGALMEGLPGTGKTFIASAMAGELQERFQKEAADKRFGFMEFSASELGNKPASYIASIFNTAEEYDACIIFIDEVDAIARHRNMNPFYNCYLELIKQMDGIEKRSNVFILASTNAPEQLDPAFVRSGRIDKRLTFSLPDKAARAVIAAEAVETRLGTLVNFDPKGKEEDTDRVVALIARRTSAFTAGDIKNVINTAFIAYHQFTHLNDPASSVGEGFFSGYQFIDGETHELKSEKLDPNIRDESLRLLWAFIEEEIERKDLGAANYSKKEKKFSTEKNGSNCSSTAIHEVGHAIVSLVLEEEPFESITIIPRGDYVLGYVSPSELKRTTKSDYENRIRVSMGGRIAEELIYGKDNISIGALQDMRNATHNARYMVEQVGLTEDFGFMALSENSGRYIGGERYYTCSDAFRERSDNAVNAMLKKLYGETLEMLADKKELIVKLAERVFEAETMDGRKFKELYEKELKRLLNN